MTAMPEEEAPHISARRLTEYDRRVARMVRELVNNYGVRYRQRDGSHILLYPLKVTDDPGSQRPFSVGSSRPPEQMMEYLERWVADYITPHLLERQMDALAEKFSDPEKRAHETPGKPTAPEAAPEPEVQEIEASQASQPDPAPPLEFRGDDEPDLPFPDDGAPSGYHQHRSIRSGKALNWWERDGGGYWRCKSCEFETDDLAHNGAHQRRHQEEQAPKSPARTPETGPSKAARTRKIRKALALIQEATGVSPAAESAKLEKRIARLEADLAKVTRQRDEYKARLDLIAEGLRA